MGHCNQVEQETLTEYLTDLCHCFEDDTGEADSHFDGFHIVELQQQGFVLGCVAQVSVRLCRTFFFQSYELHFFIVLVCAGFSCHFMLVVFHLVSYRNDL